MGEMKPIQRYFMQVAPAIGAPFGHYAESVPSEDGGWCLYADAAARIAALESELTAEREAVRVLGEEVRSGNELDEARCDKDKSDECFSKFVEAFLKWERAEESRCANPIARAAVEGRKTQ